MYLISFIIFSFFQGNLTSTLNTHMYNLLFPEFFMNTIMDTNFSFYNDVMELDTITYIWRLNPKMDSTKVPLLDVMSIKLKDTISYIGASYISPVKDTLHRVFFSFSTKTSSHKFLKNYYLAGLKAGNPQKHIRFFVFHAPNSLYLGGINARISPWKLLISPALLNDSSTFFNSSVTYQTENFGGGVFGIYSKKSSFFGPVLKIKTSNLKGSIKIPLGGNRALLGDIHLKYKNLLLIADAHMLYNTSVDTLMYSQFLRTLYSSKVLNADIWYKKIEDEISYGNSFILKPANWLHAGYFIEKDVHSVDLIPIMELNISMYNGELVNHTFWEFDNFTYLYYGVEFLLFKNLILRLRKNKYGKFAGIFVRLLN